MDCLEWQWDDRGKPELTKAIGWAWHPFELLRRSCDKQLSHQSLRACLCSLPRPPLYRVSCVVAIDYAISALPRRRDIFASFHYAGVTTDADVDADAVVICRRSQKPKVSRVRKAVSLSAALYMFGDGDIVSCFSYIRWQDSKHHRDSNLDRWHQVWVRRYRC